MATGFKFLNGSGQDITQAGEKGNAKCVVYEDNKGNKYTLNFAGRGKQLENVNLKDLILNTTYKYNPKDGDETVTNDLGQFIAKAAPDLSTYLKTTDLARKAAEEGVVNAITGSPGFAKKVYVKAKENDALPDFSKFAKKADVPLAPNLSIYLKTTDLARKAAEEGVVNAITGSPGFAKKVYIKAKENDALPDFSEFAKMADVPTATDVVAKLKADTEFKNSLKGQEGTSLTPADVAAELVKDTNKEALGKAVLKVKDPKDNTKLLLVEQLKADGTFKNSLKGQDGTSPTPAAIATELLNKTNENPLGQAVLAVVGQDGKPVLATDVATSLVTAKKAELGKAVLDLKEGEKHVLAEQLKSYSELKGVDGISPTTHNQDADNLPDSWANLI